MPEIPHTITYAPLPGATDAVSVYQCYCGHWCYQAPQAMYHLWRECGMTAEAAWAYVDAVRGQPVQSLVQTAHHTTNTDEEPSHTSNTGAIARGPGTSAQRHPLNIDAEKRAIIDASVARFLSMITINHKEV